MLYSDPESPESVRACEIHDAQGRIDPYGPFITSSEFYKTRAELLNGYRHHLPTGLSAVTPYVIAFVDEPAALQLMIDPLYNAGPFRLAHPDYQVSNILFDDEFNITGLG